MLSDRHQLLLFPLKLQHLVSVLCCAVSEFTPWGHIGGQPQVAVLCLVSQFPSQHLGAFSHLMILVENTEKRKLLRTHFYPYCLSSVYFLSLAWPLQTCELW